MAVKLQQLPLEDWTCRDFRDFFPLKSDYKVAHLLLDSFGWMFHSCVTQIFGKAAKRQARAEKEETSQTFQVLHSRSAWPPLASLLEGCWFLSSRRHITRRIKMQNTQLFLSTSVLLDKLHWRSSLCQECKSRLGRGGGKAACASQMPQLFSVYSVLSAAGQQGWCSSLPHKGQCLSSSGLVSLRAVCLFYQAAAVVLVSSLQFICFQGAVSFYFQSTQSKKLLDFWV